jgi:hypothetical protein
MSRIILSLKQILPLAGKNLDEDSLDKKMNEDNNYRHSLAKKYAKKHKLHNGATLEFPEHGYRNHNLLFWDAQNEEIVQPFDVIDDYGSVPPRFVVGDGYFNPNDWVDEVEHNTIVFPAKPLINEMKAFAMDHPDQNKMVVKINGNDYKVSYNPDEMKDKWDTCFLEVHDRHWFSVYPGKAEWRKTIIDDIEEEEPPVRELSEIEQLRQSNLALSKMVEELNLKVHVLTETVEQLRV